jgi:hypothetical protein
MAVLLMYGHVAAPAMSLCLTAAAAAAAAAAAVLHMYAGIPG